MGKAPRNVDQTLSASAQIRNVLLLSLGFGSAVASLFIMVRGACVLGPCFYRPLNLWHQGHVS